MRESRYDELQGKLLDGRYRVVRLIGRGGMGVVYEGVQQRLKKSVALKLLDPKRITSDIKLKRFQREAEVVASISHPNIAQVFDFFTHEELHGIAMELIKGASLSAVQRADGQLDPPRVVNIATQILSALEITQEAHIVHRDLKPSNVMLATLGNDEWVKLVDFGIALMTEETGVTRLTRADEVIGTPTFMAPEQLMGDTVDGRADIYSLGAIMFKALSGRPPYIVNNFEELLKALVGQRPPTVEDLAPFAPEPLCRVIIRALSKSADARFSNPRDMADALTSASSTQKVIDDEPRFSWPSDDPTERTPDSPRFTGYDVDSGNTHRHTMADTVDLRGRKHPRRLEVDAAPGIEQAIEDEHRLLGPADRPLVEPVVTPQSTRLDSLGATDTAHEVRRPRRPTVLLISALVAAIVGVIVFGSITGTYFFQRLEGADHTQGAHPRNAPTDELPSRPEIQPTPPRFVVPTISKVVPTPISITPPTDALRSDRTMKFYLADASARAAKKLPGANLKLYMIHGRGIDASGIMRISALDPQRRSRVNTLGFSYCDELTHTGIGTTYWPDDDAPAGVNVYVSKSYYACRDTLGDTSTLPDSDEVMQFFSKTRGCPAVIDVDQSRLTYRVHNSKGFLIEVDWVPDPEKQLRVVVSKNGRFALKQDCTGNR